MTSPENGRRRRPCPPATQRKRVPVGAEEQGSGRRFCRQAEPESSGLCDDAAQAGASGVKVAQVISERLK
ncbi:MAG: hypothetical protein ACLT09_09320 [Flavonifractor plautii]